MANKLAGRNDAFRRRSRAERSLRKAINDAVLDAVGDDTGRAMSDSDRDLVNEMLGRKERLAMSMMNESGMRSELVDPLFVNNKGESGRTISDADRQRAMDRASRLVADEFKELGMPTVKPRIRPQRMEEGGKAGEVPNKYKGFSKLPEKVQEKISPDLAEKYEFGGKVKGKKNKGNVCRGGGAALRGTKFSGTK